MTASIEPEVDTAVVAELPDCDIHFRLHEIRTPAAYDAATNLPGNPWAYMCAGCFPKFSTGQLGLGAGQRLILATTDTNGATHG
jgi:hypothetical protein